MSDRDLVCELLAAYCHTVDDGDWDAFEALWAADATMTVMGRTHTGAPAIRAMIEVAMPPPARGRHVTTNSSIRLRDGAASVVSDFVFVAAVEGGYAITQVGRYLDEVVAEDAGWRFAARTIELGVSRSPS